MTTARPFAFNTGSTISGTEQVGNLAVGTPTSGFTSTGLQWWNGPDENLGYVIAHQMPLGNQPNQLSVPAYLGFNRSSSLSEQSFIDLSSVIASGLTFSDGNAASSWLTSNGYWNSWVMTTPTPTPTPTPTITPTITPTPTPTPLNTELLVYLDSGNQSSYPTSGNTWYDLSGTSSNATLFNSPTYSSSYNGILQFSKASSQYGTIPDIGTLSKWTVEVWVRFTSSLTNQVAMVVGNQFNGSSSINFTIGTNGAPFSWNMQVGFFQNGWYNTTGFAPSLNTWYQIVGTYDGSTLRQYVNGVASGGTTNVTASLQSGGEIRLMRRWDDVVSSGNLFDGDLAIVKIYNNSLNSTEILNNYNSTYNRFLEPTPTPTPTQTPTPTLTPTQTPTPTISVTPTITPTISVTPSITPTKSLTPTPTITPTKTQTPTVTPTISLTPTITPTITVTPSITPTLTTGVTFSQAFTGATAPSTQIETAWNTFRAALTGTYTTFTWSSTNGSSQTVTDPTKVQSLATGLRTASITSVTINSVAWLVGVGCGTPKIGGVAVEFSNIGSCSASSTYALRPMINNANWGGTNQSTVGAPSQTITLTFS